MLKNLEERIWRFLSNKRQIKLPKIKLSRCCFGQTVKDLAQLRISLVFLTIIVLAIFVLGFWGGAYFVKNLKTDWNGFAEQISDLLVHKNQRPATTSLPLTVEPYIGQTEQERLIINAVKTVSPSVVSIVISKDMPVYEQYIERQPFGDFFGSPFEIEVPKLRQKGTQKQTIGGGTGFIVSEDGLVLTNKHVVSEQDAQYTVITSDGKKYTAKVLAKDPVQDLAVIKIQASQTGKIDVKGALLPLKFPIVRLANSDSIQIGQTVIAIGNALGEFSNSVSVGIISGLGRRITASGGGLSETLEDILQTDAAINKGNSGGPLLNLKGEVIGVNVAMAEGAQSIAFAIPINKAKRDIIEMRKSGKITRAFLGIRYVLIDAEIQQANKLSVDYGAWLVPDNETNDPAIVPGSVAAKAGLREGDIILQADGVKITAKTPLSKIIQDQHIPSDKVAFKILRDKKELTIEVILGEKSGE